MSEIVIAHDVNQSLSTSYAAAEVGMVTLEQQRRRQHNLAMAKAEAVTSRYSGICGLNPQLPVQQHRSNSNQSNSGGSGGEQLRRRRRSSAEPVNLALNKSFRKSFSSIASSDLPPGDNGDNDDGVEEIPPPPPPLKTDVTSLILTPKQQRKEQEQQQRYYDDDDNGEVEAAFSNPVTHSSLKSPPPGSYPLPQQQQQQHQRRRATESSPYYSDHHPTATSTTPTMKQLYRERPSFQATAYPPAAAIVDPYAHSHSLLSSTAMTIDDQAQMLREIQQQQQQQERGAVSPRAVADHGFYFHSSSSSTPQTAVEEQEQLWRELSRQRQQEQQQQQPYQQQDYVADPTVPTGRSTSAGMNMPTAKLSPLEEQAQLWERIQQQRQSQTQYPPPPSTCTGSPLASFPGEGRTLQGDHRVAPTCTTRIMSPLEEQAHMLQEIQRNRAPAVPVSSTYSYGGDGPATGLSAIEEQVQMLRALELHRNANASMTPDGPAMGLSAVEEQAQMLRALELQRNANASMTPNGQATGLSAVEEQAQMLRALELQRSANASMTPPPASAMTMANRSGTVVEQPTTAAANPVEQQAQRLREIQHEKEQQIVEMACKMSMEDSAPSLALSSLSGHNDQNDHVIDDEPLVDDNDLSLQYIMDLSRMEAEAHSKAQQEIDRALQVAMERSREDLNSNLNASAAGGLGGDEAAELEAANSNSHVDQEQATHLELRRSIAELACQSSELSLEAAEPSNSSGQPQRRRPWGFRYGRK